MHLMLALLTILIFIKDDYFFIILSIFALILQLIIWKLKQKISSSYGLAHDFQRYYMLSNYSTGAIDITKIENQKMRLSSYVRKKFEKKSRSEEENANQSKKTMLHNANLRRLIHENSYFNYHLFRYSYENNLEKIIITPIIFVISILLYMSYRSVNPNPDSDQFFLKAIYVLLSFSVIYDFLDSTLKYRTTIEDMRSIDNYFTQATAMTSAEMILDAFAKYNEAKSTTPNIPGRIWKKHASKLNKSWKYRQIQVIYELCKKLNNTAEPWAITGGANHYLRGMTNDINDIDIITTEEGGEVIAEILKDHTYQDYKSKSSSTIKSHFGIFEYKGFQIEIMGDPKNLINNNWEINKRWVNELEHVICNGYCFPLTKIEYEIYIYGELGNLKKRNELIKFKESLSHEK